MFVSFYNMAVNINRGDRDCGVCYVDLTTLIFPVLSSLLTVFRPSHTCRHEKKCHSLLRKKCMDSVGNSASFRTNFGQVNLWEVSPVPHSIILWSGNYSFIFPSSLFKGLRLSSGKWQVFG